MQAPAEHQRRAAQADDQPLPEPGRAAGCAEQVGESQHVAHRQTDAPVAGQGDQHHRPGVLVAAQGAGGGHLDAVGELEERGVDQQGAGQGDHCRVRRVEAGDALAKQHHQRGREARVDQCHADAQHRGEACVTRRVAAQSLTHAHGDRHGQGQGHHEHQRRDAERDLMAGHHGGAQAADQQGDHREDAGLGEDRHADRQSDPQQRADQ